MKRVRRHSPAWTIRDWGSRAKARAGRPPRRERATPRPPPAEIDQQSHPDTGGVPARGAQPAEMRARRLGLVEMKRLRIQARPETLYILRREQVAPQIPDLADGEVVQQLPDPGRARARAP